jgi:hypothetical protein
MQDLSDSESTIESTLEEGIDIPYINNNEHLTYIKEFPITPIYNTFFPNILPDDDFDYSDMPELISVDTDSEDDLNLDDLNLDDAPESESVLEPSLNINHLNINHLNINHLNLDEIKRNIESTVNISSASDCINALNNPDQLMNRIQGAFDSFKSQVGRNMTYSEMREMMG